MLKKLAIAIVAAGLIAAPALAQNSSNMQTPAAQSQVKQVKPAKAHAKHATKKTHAKKHQSSRAHHVKHVRAKVSVRKAG